MFKVGSRKVFTLVSGLKKKKELDVKGNEGYLFD